MNAAIRLIAEYYNTETGEVISSEVLRKNVIKKPTSIKELGYLHVEQIALLKSIQDFKLLYETRLLNQEETCPKCGKKTKSNGTDCNGMCWYRLQKDQTIPFKIFFEIICRKLRFLIDVRTQFSPKL